MEIASCYGDLDEGRKTVCDQKSGGSRPRAGAWAGALWLRVWSKGPDKAKEGEGGGADDGAGWTECRVNGASSDGHRGAQMTWGRARLGIARAQEEWSLSGRIFGRAGLAPGGDGDERRNDERG